MRSISRSNHRLSCKPRKKRSDALPLEEKKRRDRESWAKSRAKTGNWSSRAYNLAIQDVARWVREEHADIWEQCYQVRVEEQKARVVGGELVECSHDEIEEVEVIMHSVRCTGCRQMLGMTVAGSAPQGYQQFTGDGGRVIYRRSA